MRFNERVRPWLIGLLLVAGCASAPPPAPPGMVLIPAGQFKMGSDYPSFYDARPIHEVDLPAFYIDEHEVTNEEFERFVRATSYKTIAERLLNPADFPGADPKDLKPGSTVFSGGRWRYVAGANWRHPEGPGSNLAGRERHPVVHVAYDDAAAYAKWAGKRLPTEAEWEKAARGGLVQAEFVWGEELRPGGKWMANIFQGSFPTRNTKEDGYAATSPVGSFPPNGFGLYDMAGNVWEWCSDWHRSDSYERPSQEGFDPAEPSIPKRVQRGGSFLCTDQYCERFRPGARGKGAPDTGSNNVGFRCVQPIESK